jgi:hypothetical protein
MREDRKTDWVSFEEIIEAIDLVNTTKACGTDLTFPEILKLTDVKVHLARYIEDILNQPEIKIPDYMRESRLVLLSKGNSCFAQIQNTRPIAVQNLIPRIIEKLIMMKCDDLFETGNYQTGFKKGNSTHFHSYEILKSIKEH